MKCTDPLTAEVEKAMREKKRKPLRECWVWWHTGRGEGPCSNETAARDVEPYDRGNCANTGGRWVRMREVRRARYARRHLPDCQPSEPRDAKEVMPSDAGSDARKRLLLHDVQTTRDSATPAPAAAMTGGGGGDLREALRRVDEACPCRLPNVKEIINACRGWCDCSIGKEQGASCLWPGHAAARDLARVAAEWGFDHTIGYGYPRPMARKALDAILEGRDDEA